MSYYKGLIKNLKRNRIRFILFTLISFIVFLSCGRKSFSNEEEMWNYLNNEENGYKQEKTINGVTYSLLYKPTDLMVNQELGSGQETIKKLREKYTKQIYFVLTMSKNGQELLNSATGSREEFGAMVNQLAFQMNDKVHLYTPKKDTLELLDFIYPRMYGMSGNTSMLFVFPKDEKCVKEDYLNFTIEDLGFYTGEVKFKILTKKIINEPKLSF